MRATLVGHACWVIETSAGCFLTDPLLFDPFEEGTVTACPQRQVSIERLPALRGIFVSHRHLDHCDFPSLAALDRSLPVFCPADSWLMYALRHLGFTDMRELEPFVPHQIDTLRLTPTPSLNPDVQECGLVLQDESGTLFNQVDTILHPEAIQRLRHAVGPLDVHLAMYASQHFGLFESQRAQTAAVYAANLTTAHRLGARYVVPASAGFRFVDELDWLNRHVFPITAERFVSDVQRISPQVHPAVVHPGDTLVLEHGVMAVQRQAVDYVRMLQDDTWRLTYDASAPVPPLRDRNPAGYGTQGLQEFVQGLLDVGLPQYLQRGLAGPDEVAGRYAALEVVYQVEVVFPHGAQFWTYQFRRQNRTYHLQRGTGAPTPQVRLGITASALVDLCLGRRGYVYVRTQSRRSCLVFETTSSERGIAVRQVSLPDLLIHYIINEMAGAEHRGTDWIHFVSRGLTTESRGARHPGQPGQAR